MRLFLLRRVALFLAALLPTSALTYRVMATLSKTELAGDKDDRDLGGPPSAW